MNERSADATGDGTTDAVEETDLRRRLFLGRTRPTQHQRHDEQSGADEHRPRETFSDPRLHVAEHARDPRGARGSDGARDGDRGRQTEQSDELPPGSAARTDEREHDDEQDANAIQPTPLASGCWNEERERDGGGR